MRNFVRLSRSHLKFTITSPHTSIHPQHNGTLSQPYLVVCYLYNFIFEKKKRKRSKIYIFTVAVQEGNLLFATLIFIFLSIYGTKIE